MNSDTWYNRLANLVIGLSLLITSLAWLPLWRSFRAGGLNKSGFEQAGYLDASGWASPDNGWCEVPRPQGSVYAMGNSLTAIPSCVQEVEINWDSLLSSVFFSMVIAGIILAILWYVFIGPSSTEYSECEDPNCPCMYHKDECDNPNCNCVDHSPKAQPSDTTSPMQQKQIPSHSGG